MADAGQEAGSIEPHEREMIHSVFEFGERVVSEVMKPRPNIVALSITDTLDVAAERGHRARARGCIALCSARPRR